MQLFYKIIYLLLMVTLVFLGALLIISSVPISGVKIKIVKSGSMEPAIKTGSIVVDVPQSSYNVGDVVTFGADTKVQIPTTHRIVNITGEGQTALYTTKGDANDAPDPTQTRLSDIHGKVIFSAPYVGYVLNFARQPAGFALMVGVPAGLIIIEEISKIIREVRILRRKKKQPAPQSHEPQNPDPEPKKRIVN